MFLKTISLAALAALASASPAPVKRQSDLDQFVQLQRSISLKGLLANIGGLNSSLAANASAGVVVASPSTVNPNYYYTWTRDSALTYIVIIDELLLGKTNLTKTVEDYTKAQAYLQTVTNPSGSLWPAGDGLGEPKYNTNLTRFDGTWGRPQRDGPALRATALMKIATSLVGRNQTSVAKTVYWPIILNDLKYVGQYWNQSGYELWEEVHGSSFFTLNAQHRALVEGTLLARALNTTCAACGQASQILCFLQSNFWNETGGYITADVHPNVNRSGINASPLLASIHVFDINATCNASDYQPCNSQILATHKVFVDAFREIYTINGNASAPEAVLVGRYPEDSYYGGNPWPICTLGAAELLYDAVAQFQKAGSIEVDQYSLAFFQDLYPDAEVGSYDGDALTNITQAMTDYADGFVTLIETYLPQNGSISEQFNRTTGVSLSASKLTWSFAAFVSMAQRRAGQYPPSWGAYRPIANTNLTSAQCNATSYNSTGTYKPATGAGAPNISTACASEVILAVNATTRFGQNIYIVGTTKALGNSLNNQSAVILPLNPGTYTSTTPVWYIDIWLPAGITLDYQYVLQNQSANTYVFENLTRTVEVAGCGSGQIAISKDDSSFPQD